MAAKDDYDDVEMADQAGQNDAAGSGEFYRPGEEGEEIGFDPTMPAPVDLDDDDETGGNTVNLGETVTEIELQNDSAAYFDLHSDSVFCVAAHPTLPQVVATGGGDDTAYVFDVTGPRNPSGKGDEGSLMPLSKLDRHSDSVLDIGFSRPDGRFLFTAGMDGRVVVWRSQSGSTPKYEYATEIAEVDEVAWMRVSPVSAGVFAFGGSDGSVWVFRAVDDTPDLPTVDGVWTEQLATFPPVTAAPTTAGSWSADGSLLGSVTEDGGMYIHSIFAPASAPTSSKVKGGKSVKPSSSTSTSPISETASPTTILSVSPLKQKDTRFAIPALFSIAFSPLADALAVGGPEGQIRVISVPKPRGGASTKSGSSATITVPTVIASIQVQTDSIETLAFSPTTSIAGAGHLLVSGSVDGSIAVFDCARAYALRRIISDAHADDEPHHDGEADEGSPSLAVVQIDFVSPSEIISCGNDGVVRKWDLRGGPGANVSGQNQQMAATSGSAAVRGTRATHPAIKEWKGHRGGGEGGGVLAFVAASSTAQQRKDAEVLSGSEGTVGDGGWIVTAGDDGVSLVFLS